LEPDNRNLQIHEDNENGVHLAGSTTHQIHSADELMHYHELGDKNRITALTRLVRTHNISNIQERNFIAKSCHTSNKDRSTIKKSERSKQQRSTIGN
jgi:hypothetical protein